jgi:hypothetical protein
VRYPGCRFKISHTQPLICSIFSNFHILYNFICIFLRYFIQIMHLSLKYRKTHSNSCNFSRGNINVITIIRLYSAFSVCRFKPSHNSAPILSDFFKLPYIVQPYMYFPMIFHSNHALELKVQKTALKLMQL